MAAVYFCLFRPWRRRAAGIGFGILSVLAKFALIITAPIILASWFPRARYVIAGILVVGGILAVVSIIRGSGFGQGGAGPLVTIAENSPWFVLEEWLDPDRDGRRAMAISAYVMLFLVTAVIMIRHRLTEPADILSALGLQLGLFVFFFSPSLRHWYQLWAFPFIALSGYRWLKAGAIAFTLGSIPAILTRNWTGDIQFRWNIEHPKEVSVILLWIFTLVVVLLTWGFASRQAAAIRAGQGRATRRRVAVSR
jgi:hypothetical protein